MNWMADILTMLGEHFPLMLILSVEVIVAVALAVAAIGRRSKISLIRFLHFWGSNQRSARKISQGKFSAGEKYLRRNCAGSL